MIPLAALALNLVSISSRSRLLLSIDSASLSMYHWSLVHVPLDHCRVGQLATCSLLPAPCYLLPATCYLLPATCYVLRATCYMLPATPCRASDFPRACAACLGKYLVATPLEATEAARDDLSMSA